MGYRRPLAVPVNKNICFVDKAAAISPTRHQSGARKPRDAKAGNRSGNHGDRWSAFNNLMYPGASMNRFVYVSCWILEALAIATLAVAILVPYQNYSQREYLEWQAHPSSETYKEYAEKQRQEKALRLVTMVPPLIVVVLLAGVLTRIRQKMRDAQ